MRYSRSECHRLMPISPWAGMCVCAFGPVVWPWQAGCIFIELGSLTGSTPWYNDGLCLDSHALLYIWSIVEKDLRHHSTAPQADSSERIKPGSTGVSSCHLDCRKAMYSNPVLKRLTASNYAPGFFYIIAMQSRIVSIIYNVPWRLE